MSAAVTAAAAIVVAAIYVAAGAGKLAASTTAESIREAFALPRQLLPAIRLLPAAEIALGSALVINATSRIAGAASVLLMLVFTGLIARNLRDRRDTGCNCFGALHESRTGRFALARNGVLLAMSALVAVAPGGPVALGPGGGAVTSAGMVMLAAVAAASGLAAAWRMPSRIGPGSPPLESLEIAIATDPAAARDHVEQTGRPAILIFLDPGCRPCRSAIPAIERWWAQDAAANHLVLVSRGTAADEHGLLAPFPSGRIIHDHDQVVARRYAIEGTPSAAVLLPGRRYPTVVSGADAIESVLRRAAAPLRRARFSRRSPLASFLTDERWATQGAPTRRTMLKAGGAVTVAMFAAGCGATKLTGSASPKPTPIGSTKNGKVTCPSCGDCKSCEEQATTCGECKEKCANHDLCANYANENTDHAKMHDYLVGLGFQQSTEPFAAGLTKSGTLESMSLVTPFTNPSSPTPNAFLIYQLTDGELATAVFLTGPKQLDSVAYIDSSEQIKVGKISTDLSTPSPSPVARVVEPGYVTTAWSFDTLWSRDLTDSPPSCTKVCSTMTQLTRWALSAALLTAELDPAVLAFTFALTALGILTSQATGTPWGNLAYPVLTGNLVAIEATGAGDLIAEQVCPAICKAQLKACCNYTGSCYDSDVTCEDNCPGGLTHPGAHCQVWLNGVEIVS